MEENLGRGYKHIGRGGDFISANWLNHVSAPIDKNRRVFISLVLAGLGFLLPYNCFILAVDYFQDRYSNTTIMFDISMVYIFSAFIAVILNNIFVERLSLNTRITFGYAVSLSTLLFVAFCEIDMDSFSKEISYKINLVAVSVVALGCTVQQSSYYGFTSMLPAQYTQAVMAGESAAGVWVSSTRILSKLILKDEKKNTETFFAFTIITMSLCWGLYMFIRRTTFVEFYMTLCQESKNKIVLEPTDNTGLMDLDPADTPKGQYGVLKLQVSPPPDSSVPLNSDDSLQSNTVDGGQFSAFSFANPVYEPTSNGITLTQQNVPAAAGPSFKVEDVIIKTPGRSSGFSWACVKSGMRARWQIAQQIYPYMVFIALAYFVTLCLYPGILSEITSCHFGSWMPIILLTIFNFGDLCGKMVAIRVSEMARSKMAACCSLRLLLMPLILLCCAPRGAPHIAAAGDAAPMLLSFLLGISGGVLGAAPMLAAQKRVRNDAREMAGNIMTLSYNVGLTAGSLVAYLLDEMLGPQVPTPCGRYPTIGPVIKLTTKLANLTEEATVISTATTYAMSSTDSSIVNLNISSTIISFMTPGSILNDSISESMTTLSNITNSFTTSWNNLVT